MKKTNIKITNLEWYLTKLFFNRNFSIKYGEYYFDKNTTLYNFQKKLKLGKVFFRKFVLIEGTNAKKLKFNLNNAIGLIGNIPKLKRVFINLILTNINGVILKFLYLKP